MDESRQCAMVPFVRINDTRNIRVRRDSTRMEESRSGFRLEVIVLALMGTMLQQERSTNEGDDDAYDEDDHLVIPKATPGTDTEFIRQQRKDNHSRAEEQQDEGGHACNGSLWADNWHLEVAISCRYGTESAEAAVGLCRDEQLIPDDAAICGTLTRSITNPRWYGGL